MGDGDQESTREERLQRALEQLRIYSAIAAVVERPHELCDAIFDARDTDEARRAVAAHFGLDELQATAALDAQFRRLDVANRHRIEEERTRLESLVRELQSGLDR